MRCQGRGVPDVQHFTSLLYPNEKLPSRQGHIKIIALRLALCTILIAILRLNAVQCAVPYTSGVRAIVIGKRRTHEPLFICERKRF